MGCSDGSSPEGAGGGAPRAGASSTSGGSPSTPGPTVGGAGAGGSSNVTPQGGSSPSPGGAPAAGNPGTSAGAPSTSAGAPGSGGTAGAGSTSGGQAGSTGGSTGGTTPGAGGASAGAAGSGTAGSGTPSAGFFTEDFEGGTVGQQPAGWDNFIAYVKNNTNNTPTSGAFALVDDKQKHGGIKSVHFKGGSQPAMITRPLPQGTNKLYVRAWVYMTRQLGQNPGANHETLLGIRKESGSANNEVRFGEIKGVIGTNEVPSDNISPTMDQWGKGPVVPKNTWVCIEVAFLGDKSPHELHAWADGTLVHEITAVNQWQNGMTQPGPEFLNGKFVEAIFGWQSFSSQDIEVWMDDIVLATSRVGCN